jgi:hypothetical protein
MLRMGDGLYKALFHWIKERLLRQGFASAMTNHSELEYFALPSLKEKNTPPFHGYLNGRNSFCCCPRSSSPQEAVSAVRDGICTTVVDLARVVDLECPSLFRL